MTGLGLPPAAFAAVRAVVARAVADGVEVVDARRLAGWLDRHAGQVEECPQTCPQTAPQWTVDTMAHHLGVTPRTVRRMCRAGRLAGAQRVSGRGRGWAIPAPVDHAEVAADGC